MTGNLTAGTPLTFQKPAELAWLITKLREANVRSLLTIGAAAGGVEWHLARAFRSAGRDLRIDTVEKHVRPALEETLASIREQFKQEVRLIPHNSHSDEILQHLEAHYDAVFIDGDHSYAGVLLDWTLARSLRPQVVAFHDIVESLFHRSQGCYVSRLWKALQQLPYRTIEYKGLNWGGIGLIYPGQSELAVGVPRRPSLANRAPPISDLDCPD